ncbi:MAG: 16S rRNA (guanine(966)-N(2))-methyltransferase RsmD [Trichlorobacter sp.]
MRVISGTAGGLKLTSPTGTGTRPTADRVKEALFNILQSHEMLTSGVRVLDLFAGSGALAIEALSRGAAHATLVDKSRPALDALRKNLLHTKLADQATVLPLDVFQALDQLTRQCARFDLVLLDPPYALGLQAKVLERITPLLSAKGMMVAEAASREPLPERVGRCWRIDRRVYGDTALEFFVPEGNDAP